MSIWISIENPQSNAPVERIHLVIYNIIATKYLDRKFYDYVDPCWGILASVALVIRESYHRTLWFTPGKAVFGIDILFSLTSICDWRIVTARGNIQFNIYNDNKRIQEIHTWLLNRWSSLCGKYKHVS